MRRLRRLLSRQRPVSPGAPGVLTKLTIALEPFATLSGRGRWLRFVQCPRCGSGHRTKRGSAAIVGLHSPFSASLFPGRGPGAASSPGPLAALLLTVEFGQRPVTANQAPVGDVTKMIGAKHGDGSATVVSISAFPDALAGTDEVEMFEVVATPAVVVRQLTIALNCGTGFVPCRLRGTGERRAKTRPSTSTWSCPPARRSALPESISHGRPPPATPRIAFAAPV